MEFTKLESEIIERCLVKIKTELNSEEFPDDQVRETLEVYVNELRCKLETSFRGSKSKSKLTPPELAKEWGVSPDKILTWIRNGELVAINVAQAKSGRPRYLIDRDNIKLFEKQRTVLRGVDAGKQKRKNAVEIQSFF